MPERREEAVCQLNNKPVSFGGVPLAMEVSLPGIDFAGGKKKSNGPGTRFPRARIKGRRVKLWEVNSNMLCSIVGTCLTLDDLRKIGEKLRLKFPVNIGEHEIHGYFVREASEHNAAGRMMQKRLERRHELAVNRFARISSSRDLEAEWEYCREKGDIPGPYWAILTHPDAPEDLSARVFGEVHMLSHKVGASNRNDLGERSALQRQKFFLGEELNKSRQRLNRTEKTLQEMRTKHAREIASFEGKLIHAQIVKKELHRAKQEIALFKNDAEYVRATMEAADLRQNMFELKKRAEETEKLAAIREAALLALTEAKEKLEESNRIILARCRELEAANLIPGNAGIAPGVDLSGHRIVYVGGRSGIISHFKSVVVQANGFFIHHDGGLEDKIARLPETIDQGDIVVCPVDCVSHGACLVAKKHCKRKNCPFVPLRSSGLSTFVNALTEIAETLGRENRGVVN